MGGNGDYFALSAAGGGAADLVAGGRSPVDASVGDACPAAGAGGVPGIAWGAGRTAPGARGSMGWRIVGSVAGPVRDLRSLRALDSSVAIFVWASSLASY